MELRRLGRALERERRRRAGRDDGRHRVEVAGADLALVLGRGVAARLGGELGLLWLVVVVGGCCCCCGGDEMRTRMIENKEKLEKNSKTRKTKKKKKTFVPSAAPSRPPCPSRRTPWPARTSRG